MEAKDKIGAKKYTREDFAKAYEALCAQYGFQLAYAPQWRQSLDNGSYSMVIQLVIDEYIPPKKEG